MPCYPNSAPILSLFSPERKLRITATGVNHSLTKQNYEQKMLFLVIKAKKKKNRKKKKKEKGR